MNVRELMEERFHTVRETTPVKDIFQFVREYHATDFPVLDAERRYCGMLYGADLLDAIYKVLGGGDHGVPVITLNDGKLSGFLTGAVRHLMARQPATVSSRDPVERAGALMQLEKISSLAVVEDHEVVGILTQSRVLDYLAGQLAASCSGSVPKNKTPAPEAPPDEASSKRFFKRVPVSVQVAYRLSGAEGAGRLAKTLNASAGGLLILTREQLPVGQTVHVALDIYHDNNPIRMTCRIVRCSAGSREGTYEVGLMFSSLDVQERRRLNTYLGSMA